MAIDVSFTIKIVIISIIAFLVITAWDEVLDRFILKVFNLDRESIWSWLIIAAIATFILVIILYAFTIEAHDVYGMSEIIDTILTGTTEQIEHGKVVHSKTI